MVDHAIRTFDIVYLIDTNVLSAIAPTKARSSPALASWMARNSAGLRLSVITVAEIEDGIAKARRQGGVVKADRLAAWLDSLLHLYAPRILPLDVEAARRLGMLADRARAQGQMPGFADLAIAATAQVHGATILTANLRHFDPLGVPALDPFRALPPEPG